jgi:predicted TIM-barrel fold metal-dependent hydrolase
MADSESQDIHLPGTSEHLPGSDEFAERTVVDADVHLSLRDPDILRDVAGRMEKPYANYVHPDQGGGPIYPSQGFAESLGGERSEVMKKRIVTYDDLAEGMAESGIEYSILNPLSFYDSVRERERSIQEMRAFNDVFLERFLDDHDDVYGVINVGARAPSAAAEEIDRLGDEKQVVGVGLIPGDEYHDRPLGDPRYDPIYRAAEDNGLTMVYHGADSRIPMRSAPIINDLPTFIATHAIGFPWSLEITLVSLILSGTPEKFPDLDFVMVEAGVGWMAYLMARLNREYQWRPSEAPLLEQSPEEYIRDQFYIGTHPLEEFNDLDHLEMMLQIIGSDMLMFASDYPHRDFDNPGFVNRMIQRTFSEDEQDQILHENAVEAFDLDI